MEHIIYLCDGSVDGIFTAIYDAWDSKKGHNCIRIEELEYFQNMELFTEYIQIEADSQKAEKVAAAIQKKLSEEAYEMVIRSALSKRIGRGDAIYRFLLLGFSYGPRVMEQVNHPYVHPIFEMNRNVKNEAHHYLGFLRFSELESGVLFASIRPDNAILPLISPHFEDRLMQENWIIYDEGREEASFHEKGRNFFLRKDLKLNRSEIENYSSAEERMQVFWQTFVDAIAIEGRKNQKLQYQMLPNRFREFMREVPYKDAGVK